MIFVDFLFFSPTANLGLVFYYIICTVFAERSAARQTACGEALGRKLNRTRDGLIYRTGSGRDTEH